MHITGTTRLIGLLGDPVAHSLSPAMHNAALAAAGIDAVYVALPVKPDALPAVLDGLRAVNFIGANVTIPHKSAVIPLVEAHGEISPLARKLGAVNTIVHRPDGTLYGDTTDAAGFTAAFEEAGQSFDGTSVAILGNGGSARTIAIGLPGMRAVRRLALVGRSVSKVEALAAEVRSHYPALQVEALTPGQYADVRDAYDIVVNTTPVGMHPEIDATPLPAELLEARQVVYDIVYNPRETRLLREARARGCTVVGGLGMLIHQGRIAFGLWTGRELPPDIFREGIRAQGFLSGPSESDPA